MNNKKKQRKFKEYMDDAKWLKNLLTTKFGGNVGSITIGKKVMTVVLTIPEDPFGEVPELTYPIQFTPKYLSEFRSNLMWQMFMADAGQYSIRLSQKIQQDMHSEITRQEYERHMAEEAEKWQAADPQPLVMQVTEEDEPVCDPEPLCEPDYVPTTMGEDPESQEW